MADDTPPPDVTCDPTEAQVPAQQISLDALVAARMATPFTWGTQDCCMFAADCVQAQTGVDPAADVRGSYSTALDALSLLASLGGIATVGARAGAPITPLLAQAGDIGLVLVEGNQLLALCVGPVWLAPAATGLAALPFESAVQAWRVPRG